MNKHTSITVAMEPPTGLSKDNRRLLREALESVSAAIHGAYDDLSGEDLSRLARAQTNITRVLAKGVTS